jgi:hypothetical protein
MKPIQHQFVTHHPNMLLSPNNKDKPRQASLNYLQNNVVREGAGEIKTAMDNLETS